MDGGLLKLQGVFRSSVCEGGDWGEAKRLDEFRAAILQGRYPKPTPLVLSRREKLQKTLGPP